MAQLSPLRTGRKRARSVSPLPNSQQTTSTTSPKSTPSQSKKRRRLSLLFATTQDSEEILASSLCRELVPSNRLQLPIRTGKRAGSSLSARCTPLDIYSDLPDRFRMSISPVEDQHPTASVQSVAGIGSSTERARSVDAQILQEAQSVSKEQGVQKTQRVHREQSQTSTDQRTVRSATPRGVMTPYVLCPVMRSEQ